MIERRGDKKDLRVTRVPDKSVEPTDDGERERGRRPPALHLSSARCREQQALMPEWGAERRTLLTTLRESTLRPLAPASQGVIRAAMIQATDHLSATCRIGRSIADVAELPLRVDLGHRSSRGAQVSDCTKLATARKADFARSGPGLLPS